MAIFTAIGAAIGLAASWVTGLGVVGSFLLRTAVGVGLSALSKKLAGKVGAESSPFVVQGSIQGGGTVPRSFMLGPSLTAGSLVWHTEWGEGNDTSNAFYTKVIALSDLPVAGLRTWFIDGRAVTLSAVESDKGFAAEEYTVDGKDHAWIKFFDGTQTVAPDFLTATVSVGAPRNYSADRIGTGVAYAVVTFRVNQELFSGWPQSKFVLDGVPLYDVSKDSSEGGDGDQRWNDPATWGGDGDQLPAVQAYNLSRGITYGGKWFYGLQGMTSARLPSAHWISQIEKCRALVQGDGGMEPIYRSAGEIAVNAEIGSAIEEILTTCAGRMSEIGGVFKIYVGAPDAPIAHFTDDDIVSLSSQSFTPFFGLSDTVNGVVATYPSPEDGYEMTATPPLYNAAYEVEDGGRRLLTNVALTFVPFKVQAQRLLKGELAAARRARRYTFTLPACFRRLEPGDVVTWSSKRNGYDGKQFRVDGVIDLPNCDLIVDMTEVDPADHGDFDFDNDYTPVNPVPVLPVRPTAQGVIGFAPEPLVIQDALDAARRPALLMKWNATVTDIAGIMFEIRLASSEATSEAVFKAETRDFAKGELPVETGLVAGTLYEVRAKYIPGSPRAVDWTGWVAVATPDVRLGEADLADEIRAEIAKGEAAIQAATAAGQAAAAITTKHNTLVAGFVGTLKNAFDGVTQNIASLSSSISGVATNLAQNYFTKTDTNDAIAASETTLTASIAKVADSLTGTQWITDEVSDLTAGAAVTLALGPADLQQAGTVMVSEGATARDTGGATNGASIKIGPERALLFAGQRVKIGVLAKKPAANAASSFGIAYSTASNGNSGYMRSELALGTDWAWHTFYYDVPAAISGTTNNYVGIFGDDAKSGKGTQIARVYVGISAATGELPDLVNLQGDVQSILGLDLDAVSGTALGVLLDQLNVSSGGTSATITQQGTAIADLEGNASAGYLIKAQAGGQVSLLELIAADGTSGSVSVAKIAATQILLDGTVSANMLAVGSSRNMLINTDFSDGTKGYTSGSFGAAGGESVMSLRSSASSYTDGIRPVLQISQTGVATTGFMDIYPMWLSSGGSSSQMIEIEPQQRYEFSAYISTHRCTGNLLLQWFDAAGAIISTVSVVIPTNAGSNTDPNTWQRPVIFASAPDNAKFVRPIIRKGGTLTGTTSFLFVHHPMLAQTHATATVAQAYVARNGVTWIDGGKVTTNSLTADKINVVTLSAISATIGILRTATSGARMEIHTDKILVFDASNALRVKIGNLS